MYDLLLIETIIERLWRVNWVSQC